MGTRKFGFALPLILVVVVVGMVVVGAFAYFQLKPKPAPQTQPKQTPQATSPASKEKTANWKTYKGSQFQVQFEYPDSWILRFEKKEAVSFSSPEKNVLLIRDTLISLVGDIPTLDSYVDQTIKFEQQLGNKLISRENIVLGDNIRGILWTIQSPERLTQTTSFQQNNKVYEITLTATSEAQLNRTQEIYSRILSTFRFD